MLWCKLPIILLQAFFVHFLGGWLRIFPPVAWVIFLKLLELFQSLELFEKILTEDGYFLFNSLKFVHEKWYFLWDISILAFLFHFIKKNPRFALFRQFFALKLSKKPPVPWVFSQKFLELFWKIPWVIFRLSYFGLELFCQRTKKSLIYMYQLSSLNQPKLVWEAQKIIELSP